MIHFFQNFKKIFIILFPDLLVVAILLYIGTHPFNNHYKYQIFNNRNIRNRDAVILSCYNGLQHTGQILIQEYDYTDSLGIKKQGYYQTNAIGDDVGIYYIIPLLMKYFNKDFWTIFNAFFAFIIILTFLIGINGIKLLYQNLWVRIVSYIYISIFTLYCFSIIDVYIWSSFLVSFIPLFIYVFKNSISKNKFICLSIFIFLMGILIGIGNQFRIHSGTGLLIFIILYIIFYNKKHISINYKIVIIIILFLSSSLCSIYFYFVIQNRDTWLKENNQGLIQSSNNMTHILWQSVYLGLAIIKNNKYGIVLDDWYAYKKAYSIDSTLTFNTKLIHPIMYDKKYSTDSIQDSKSKYFPVIGDKRYENIMKQLFFSILIKDPFFILKTYLLKTWYVFIQLLIFFNLGLILLFFIKPKFKEFSAFLIIIIFYSLPGIIVWPDSVYILGALSICIYSMLILLGEYTKKNLS